MANTLKIRKRKNFYFVWLVPLHFGMESSSIHKNQICRQNEKYIEYSAKVKLTAAVVTINCCGSIVHLPECVEIRL